MRDQHSSRHADAKYGTFLLGWFFGCILSTVMMNSLCRPSDRLERVFTTFQVQVCLVDKDIRYVLSATRRRICITIFSIRGSDTTSRSTVGADYQFDRSQVVIPVGCSAVC